MQILDIAGLVIALYGAWFVYKGNKTGFKPRVLNGWALVMVGASLMVREVTLFYWTLLIAGVVLFVQSLRTQWALARRRR